MTTTQPTTGALHDALRDLDRSDLATDTGRIHALNTLDQLDRWLTDLRDYVTALDTEATR